jgi:hypothetical protein
MTNLRKRYHRSKALKLQYPKDLTPVSYDDIKDVPLPDEQRPDFAWLSRKYLVLLYAENHPENVFRVSVCSTKKNQNGWLDGFSWDELNEIKRAIGFHDWYAIEIYPPDEKIVNVANFRHLWIMEKSLGIGWNA